MLAKLWPASVALCCLLCLHTSLLHAEIPADVGKFFEIQLGGGFNHTSLKRPIYNIQEEKITENSYYGFGFAYGISIYNNYFLRFGGRMKNVNLIRNNEVNYQIQRDVGDTFKLEKNYDYLEGDIGLLYYFRPEYSLSLSYIRTVASHYHSGKPIGTTSDDETHITSYTGAGLQGGVGKLWQLAPYYFINTEFFYSYVRLVCVNTGGRYTSACQQSKGLRQEVGLRLSITFAFKENRWCW